MKYWMHLIFILLVIPFGFTQEIHVNLSIDQNDLEVGAPVIITVTSNVKGDFTIDFPSSFTALPGVHSGMNNQIDYRSGKSETVYFITRTGSFQQVGKYNFRAKLKTRKKTYQSNSVTVRVENKKSVATKVISRKDSNKPLIGTVEIQKKTVYEGESILVYGKIYTKYNMALETYKPYEVSGYPEIKSIPSPEEPVFTPITINGQQYFETPFDQKILFFGAPGKYEVAPFKMGVLYETDDDYVKYEFKSNKEIIEVLPLPSNAPESFTGGIGEFKFSRKFDLAEVKQGDVVVMTVVVEGEGNVHNISTPQFNLPDGVIQYGDPEITESVSYKQIGSKGKKVYKFHLQFLEKGKFTIPPMEISFFHPKDKKYISLKSEGVAVNVLKSSQFQNQILDKDAELVTIIDSDSMDEKSGGKSKISTETVVLLSVILPISLGGFLFFFLKRKPKKELEVISDEVEEMSEMEQISILLEESSRLQLKGDFKTSFHQLESAIRMMVIQVTESTEERVDQTNLRQQLSEILVICETARFLNVYDPHQAQMTQIQASSILKAMNAETV